VRHLYSENYEGGIYQLLYMPDEYIISTSRTWVHLKTKLKLLVSLTCGSSESISVIIDLLLFGHKTFVIHINNTAYRFIYRTLINIISVMSKPVLLKRKLYGGKNQIPFKICL
jgi:hypothetical protein